MHVQILLISQARGIRKTPQIFSERRSKWAFSLKNGAFVSISTRFIIISALKNILVGFLFLLLSYLAFPASFFCLILNDS